MIGRALAVGTVLLVGLLSSAALSSGSAGELPGSIDFVGRNLVATARGTFHAWRITHAKLDLEDPSQSMVDVEIDVASLDTGIDRRDRHLRTEDFFDVEKFPLAKVRAHSPVKTGQSEGLPVYDVKLDLEIHGHRKTVTAQVVVTASDPIEIRGEVVLDRNDFGIGEPRSRFNPMSIRNEVPVTFTARLDAGETTAAAESSE